MTEHTAAEGTGSAAASAESSKPSTLIKILRIVAILAVVGVVIYFGRQASDYFLAFANWVKSQGALGPVIFMAGYAIFTVIGAPGSILTLLGGAIFGLGWGTLYVFIGATTGASLAFLVARYLARGMVERRIEGSPKFSAIDRAVGRQGLKIVALLRLSPVFPFNLLNYGLGLTRVRFVDYVIACFGMLPGTFLYVYYGKAAGDIAAVAAGGASTEKGTGYWVVMGLGLAATVVVTYYVTKIARRALEEETEIDEIDEIEAEASDE